MRGDLGQQRLPAQAAMEPGGGGVTARATSAPASVSAETFPTAISSATRSAKGARYRTARPTARGRSIAKVRSPPAARRDVRPRQVLERMRRGRSAQILDRLRVPRGHDGWRGQRMLRRVHREHVTRQRAHQVSYKVGQHRSLAIREDPTRVRKSLTYSNYNSATGLPPGSVRHPLARRPVAVEGSFAAPSEENQPALRLEMAGFFSSTAYETNVVLLRSDRRRRERVGDEREHTGDIRDERR